MQGPSHLILGWFIGEACGLPTPRLRRIVALAGLASDLDVLAFIGAYFYTGLDLDRAFVYGHQAVHHRYTHGVGFVLLAGLVSWLYILARGPGGADALAGPLPRRGPLAAKAGLLAAVAATVHIFCDLIGSGYDWPIYPLWPLSNLCWGLSWSWTLGEWPNMAMMWFLLAAALLYGRRVGHSFAESINYRMDRWMVRILRTGTDKSPESVKGKA